VEAVPTRIEQRRRGATSCVSPVGRVLVNVTNAASFGEACDALRRSVGVRSWRVSMTRFDPDDDHGSYDRTIATLLLLFFDYD
jgi:hypothetical protein